jgi:hypothetical protein
MKKDKTGIGSRMDDFAIEVVKAPEKKVPKTEKPPKKS